jgi:hypothetical protein
VNDIIRKELGYPNYVDHLESRGWTRQKRPDGTYTLMHRKLQFCEELQQAGPGEFKPVRNLAAMIEKMYEFLNQDSLKDPLTGEPPMSFLKLSSFIGKINDYAQDLHTAVVITQKFFLPFVPERKLDTDYWLKKIFADCGSRRELVTHSNNLLSLFPTNSPGTGTLQERLISHHEESMKDEVARLAQTRAHTEEYKTLVEQQMKDNFKRSCYNTKRKPEKNICIIRSRCRDQTYTYMSAADKSDYSSSTRHKRQKNTCASKRKSREF